MPLSRVAFPKPAAPAGSAASTSPQPFSNCAARPASPAHFHPRALVKSLWDICLITAAARDPRNVSPLTQEHVVCSCGLVRRSLARTHGPPQLSFRSACCGEFRKLSQKERIHRVAKEDIIRVAKEGSPHVTTAPVVTLPVQWELRRGLKNRRTLMSPTV